MSQNREQLQQIAALIKGGKKAEASKMLVPLLKAAPNDAAAWWLMVNAVSDTEHKKRALKRFLQLRPGDEKGQAMLAKLEPPAPVVEDDDPFSDPDNPFVAAKQESAPARQASPRKSFLNNDDPFGDVDGDDDPFSDVKSTPALVRSTNSPVKVTAPRTSAPPRAASGGNSSMLILGAVVLIAVIAIGAAVLLASTRSSSTAAPLSSASNADSNVDLNAYVEPVVRCTNEESVFNQNDDEGARLPSRVSDEGTLNVGDNKSGFFSGSNELHGYSFNGSSGQWIVIEMWSPDNSIDPRVEVYDPDGLQFAFCDDSDSLDTYMEVRLPRYGQYTIVAQQFGISAGDYQISVRER